MKSFYFLKKDLRLIDNKALLKACKESESLKIVYCIDDDFSKTSSAQKHFIHQSLSDLNSSLKKMGSKLFVAEESADKLVSTTKDLERVYISKIYNSREQKGSADLRNICEKNGVSFVEVENGTLYELRDLPFELQNTPRVFTDFRKKIEKEKIEISFLEIPQMIPKSFESEAIDFEAYKNWSLGAVQNKAFEGGEAEGQKRLRHYLWGTDSAKTYKDTRNGMLEFDDSTKFSPWLAVGALSPRDVIKQLKEYENDKGTNDSTYWIYFELLWREYFKLYSQKYESLIFEIGGIDQKKIETSSDQEDDFASWKQATTPNDFINANMNELKQTGWMSNRGRQNVASYLSKELLVNWRWGAQWFAENLIDYDVESNWGNWNYLAGVGVDPRDRKFNTQRQAGVYDPEGKYVARFLSQK